MPEATNTTAAESSRQRLCEKDYDVEKMEGYFDFADGTKLVVDVNKFNDTIKRYLMLHGLIQKVGDSFAGVKGDVKSAVSNASDVISSLNSGAWKGEREGGFRIGALAEAIARMRGVDVSVARAHLTPPEGASEEKVKELQLQINRLRTHPKIKQVMAQIAAEKANAEAAGVSDDIDFPMPV